MPSNVGPSVAARMQKVAGEVGRADRVAANGAGLAAETVLLAEVGKAAPGLRLRGVGRTGAKVGVRHNVRGAKSPTAIVRAVGPLHLIENPSKPHEIQPRKRGGKKALSTPYGPRASVQHPGVRNPKRPWAKGKPKAEAAAVKVLDHTYRSAFKRGATR